MFLDLTFPMDKDTLHLSPASSDASLIGHVGTHFDVMDKVFPLDYCQTDGIYFDVQGLDREIEIHDIALDRIQPGMFVIFHTGFSTLHAYDSDTYKHAHPQLSHALIDALLSKHISMIGIDAAGIRRHAEHTPADQLCADHNVFVIENLYGLEQLKDLDHFTVYTFPLRYTGISGLPCRVLAQIQ